VRLDTTNSPSADRAIEYFRERWPWLDGDDEEDDDPGDRGTSVFIGGAHFFVAAGRAVRFPGGELDGPRHPQDPVWILDALAGAGPSTEAQPGTHPVTVDLRAAGPGLRLPEHGHVERPTLRAEVTIGDDGLVRRVDWSQPPRGRKRLRARRPDSLPPPVRHVTELSDFGVDADIAIPEADEPEDVSTARAIWELTTRLHRLRADYRREHPDG
jgi:hypothetical protein